MHTESLPPMSRSQPYTGSNRSAFWQGFARGMAAPAMLFSSYPAPEVRQYAMAPLYRPARSDRESLRNDMVRIGNDIRRAVQKYDEE